MTEHEHLMYQVLGNISATDAPIVFKGALITKLILAENKYAEVERKTADIDANWVGAPPSMDYLVEVIQKSLGDMKEQFYAVAIRQYKEGKSAGISIRANGTEKEIMTMDISIKPVIGSRIYHFGEISINGVLPKEILADKIAVISKPLVFRRAKDLIDVYALTHCVETRTDEIFDVLKNKSVNICDFKEFLTRRNEVEHSYIKLKGIEGKPPFDDVYLYLTKLITPFMQKDLTPRVWNSNKLLWDNCRERKPAMLEKIQMYKEKIALEEQKRQRNTKEHKKGQNR